MKKLLFISSFFLALSGFAQSKTLPYKNGFTTAGEKTEFTSLREGITTSYNWNISIIASHDYPVGSSSDDTTRDWLFSPPIKVSADAILSFRYYVYGITGSATPNDEFSVWYGRGSKNPRNGTFVKILDLTSKVQNTYKWVDTANVELPFASDTGYIVFKYQATNNWFVIGVDSIVVKKPGLSVDKKTLETQVELFPNPGNNLVSINSNENILDVSVTDLSGRLSAINTNLENKVVDVSTLPAGVYTFAIRTQSGVKYKRFFKINI